MRKGGRWNFLALASSTSTSTSTSISPSFSLSSSSSSFSGVPTNQLLLSATLLRTPLPRQSSSSASSSSSSSSSSSQNSRVAGRSFTLNIPVFRYCKTTNLSQVQRPLPTSPRLTSKSLTFVIDRVSELRRSTVPADTTKGHATLCYSR
ncbi:hypothetical protein E2C01_035046 [Portunus trituberculatus]|uniref:Uncharacterized protein n=1 Tax=Portunus trituberculatus TaxID=210409 RepID=A0A5B7FAE5_PORTR|nr:hypothetical protein [Portunus trituberculatus]